METAAICRRSLPWLVDLHQHDFVLGFVGLCLEEMTRVMRVVAGGMRNSTVGNGKISALKT